MDVRNAGIEEADEALDQSDHFDLQLIGADNRAVNGRIQGRRVSTGGKDSDSLHDVGWMKPLLAAGFKG